MALSANFKCWSKTFEAFSVPLKQNEGRCVNCRVHQSGGRLRLSAIVSFKLGMEMLSSDSSL